jgi:paraquat-inducible protein A
MTIEIEGRSQHNSLISGVIAFWQSGYEGLSVLVFLMSVMLPLMTLLSMLYVLLPLKLGRRPWKLAPVFRIVEAMRPWAMMEVFMLGVLVALVKLADFATVIPGVALYTFGALIIVTASSSAALDSRIIWEKLSERS